MKYGFEDWYCLLAESYVDKQVNKAARYIERNHSRLIGLERTQAGNPKTAKDLANDVKNQMPILVSKDNNPKPGKFIVGASRIFYDEIDNNQRDVSPQLSRYIRTLIQDGHTDQFDEDLNGMSFEQLEQTFSKRTQEAGQNEKNEFSARKWERNPEYDIVRIDSTEEAKPYRRFLNPRMPWCITGDQHYYDSYTNGGLGVFYFVLKKGYENLTPEKGENSPHDEYGESMMAVAVDENGQLLNCTSRWNGSGDFFTAKQLSELLGVNFYETFLPRSFEETVKKLDFRPILDGSCPLLTKLGYMIPKKKGEDFDVEYSGDDWIKAGKPNYEKKEIEWVYYRKADFVPYGYRDEDALPEIVYSRKTGRFASSEPIRKLKEKMLPTFTDENPIPIFISKDIQEIDDFYFSGGITDRFQAEEGNKRYFVENGALYDRENEYGMALRWADRNLETLNIKEGTIVLDMRNSIDSKWKSVHLPEGLKYIKSMCFQYCKNLTTINWPKSLQSIGEFALQESAITEIDTAATIYEGAFKNCQGLKKVRVRPSEESYESFERCTIESLEILPGTEEIGPACFSPATIKEVKFPEGLKSIMDSAFFGSRGFTSVVFPSSFGYFGSNVFYGCRDLESVKFMGNIHDCGYGVFEGCTRLKSVKFNGDGQIDYKAADGLFGSRMFVNCTSLKSIRLPSGYCGISENTFMGCLNLETVFIPEGYSWIGAHAFNGDTNLDIINIPSTMEEIGLFAFKGCAIGTVYIHKDSKFNALVTVQGDNIMRKKWTAHSGLIPEARLVPYTDISQTPLAGLAQGGGGTPDSPASEPQTQMESFSGFLSKKRGLHGF